MCSRSSPSAVACSDNTSLSSALPFDQGGTHQSPFRIVARASDTPRLTHCFFPFSVSSDGASQSGRVLFERPRKTRPEAPGNEKQLCSSFSGLCKHICVRQSTLYHSSCGCAVSAGYDSRNGITPFLVLSVFLFH